MSSARVTFRTALEPDLDRLLDIHLAAFPDPRGEEVRLRNFAQNPLGSLDDLHVAEAGGVIVAHAFLFSMAGWFGGVRVQVGGIASVGVAPEARGRGVGRALLQHLHDLAHARGDAITLLYAVRQSYYAQLGYASVSPMKRLVIAPSSIPPAFRAAGDAAAVAVRAAGAGDRPAVEDAYLRAARVSTGMLERPQALWNARFSDPRRQWFVAERGGTVLGYLAFTLHQADAHARITLRVTDLFADDDVARNALLGMLRAMRDQVASLELEVHERDPLDRALLDPDAHRFGDDVVEHEVGVISAGPMVRLADVERALLARGYSGSGGVDLHVDGRASPIALRVEGGRPSVGGRAAGGFPLRLDSRALGAVLYGALAPRDAVRLGWVHADASSVALTAADALLALPPFVALDTF